MINKIITISFAVLALAASLAGCSHDIDVYGQAEKEAEFNDQFKNNVLGGQAVDANQTWSTAEKATVSVNVNLDYGKSYKVYVFTANPLLNKEAKYIGMGTIVSGGQLDITIARPADVTLLFAACVDDKGAYTVQQFQMEGENGFVSFGQAEAAARRGAQRISQNLNGYNTNRAYYIRQQSEFIDDLKNYNNGWAGYYDLSKVDENDPLNKIEYPAANNYQATNAHGDNTHFLLPEGKSFTLSKNSFNNGMDGTVIVVKGILTIPNWDEFRLWGEGANSNATHGQTIVIERGGKVVCNAKKLTLANKSNVINLGGTLELNGTYVDYANGADKGFYNAGTIKGKKVSGIDLGFNFAGGTPYYNAGTIDLSDDGVIKFNGNIVFTNVGHIHADNCAWNGVSSFTDWGMASAGQNAKVYNLCEMTFEKFFGVHDYIGIDGSLLWAKGGLYTNAGGVIVLGKQAQIECGDWYDNGVTAWASSNANEYAVLRVNGTLNEVNGGIVGANGYFYFDINSIDGSRDGGWHKTQFENKMLRYTVSEATAPAHVTIPADAEGCNALGYNAEINGGGGGNFTPNYIYYAFEDLGTIGDFDFNDVVIRVSAPVEGQSTVQIVAAGGTMETYVTYGKGENPTRLGAEVHAAMGENTVSKMINTSGVDTEKFANLGTIQLAADADLTQLPLGIQVIGNNGQTIRVTRSVEGNGRAPLVIVVSGNDEGKWFWPTEKTNIVVAYEDFGAWGANVSSNPDWYKNASGSVVSF